MKNLFGVAALVLAFSPFAQAQALPDHPDARNDRRPESEQTTAKQRHHTDQKRMKHPGHKEHKM